MRFSDFVLDSSWLILAVQTWSTANGSIAKKDGFRGREKSRLLLLALPANWSPLDLSFLLLCVEVCGDPQEPGPCSGRIRQFPEAEKINCA